MQDLKVYVINLDRRPDLWKASRQTLQRAGFKSIERVPAIDGKLLSKETVRDHVDPQVFKHIHPLKRNFKEIEMYREIARYMSHIKVWMMIAERNERALVVEDDMECHALFNEFSLCKNPSSLSNYEFVLLASTIREQNKLKKTDIHTSQGIYEYDGSFLDTYFYYLTPHGANYFIKDSIPLLYPLETYMSIKIKNKDTRFRSGVHRPNMGTRDPSIVHIQMFFEDHKQQKTKLNIDKFKQILTNLFIILIFIILIALIKILNALHNG